MGYDFKAARAKRMQLAALYCNQKDDHDELWAFGVLAQIEELDREIEEAGRQRTDVVVPFRPRKNSPTGVGAGGAAARK